MQTFTIEDPIYCQGFDLVVGCDVGQLAAFIRERTGCTDYEPKIGSVAKAVRWESANGAPIAYFLWMQEWRGSPEEVGRLAHEAYHHTCNVMETVGVDDEEAYAYYLAWVVRTCIAPLTRYAIKREAQEKRRTRRRSRSRRKPVRGVQSASHAREGLRRRVGAGSRS